MNHHRLVCTRCGWNVLANGAVWQCGACQGPLTWDGPSALSRAQFIVSEPSLWRFAKALPVDPGHAVRLGEHVTPLLEVEFDGLPVHWKLDYLLPTGSFKDRGSAVLLSFLKSAGVATAIEDSSGNAAASIAAYAARAGIACAIYAPATASRGKLVQTAAYGADVHWIEGSRDDVAQAAMDVAASDPSVAYASHNWHPFFLEGVKTWALEVWEQLGYRAPDHVVVPVGSGSMVLGAYRAFEQLQTAGEMERLPRLFAAQPAACAPIDAAFKAGWDDVEPFDRQPTAAEGASIASPVRGREVLTAISVSGGGTVAVSESEIASAQRDLALRGIYVEPTSAVAAAGLRTLRKRGELPNSGTTVVMLSGSGLKATETIQRLMEGS